MRVEGMWPYWLDGQAPSTVKNSFDMSSMFLLTGEQTVGPPLARLQCVVWVIMFALMLHIQPHSWLADLQSQASKGRLDSCQDCRFCCGPTDFP